MRSTKTFAFVLSVLILAGIFAGCQTDSGLTELEVRQIVADAVGESEAETQRKLNAQTERLNDVLAKTSDRLSDRQQQLLDDYSQRANDILAQTQDDVVREAQDVINAYTAQVDADMAAVVEKAEETFYGYAAGFEPISMTCRQE